VGKFKKNGDGQFFISDFKFFCNFYAFLRQFPIHCIHRLIHDENHNNVFFLKTLFLLIKRVHIKNLISDYTVPEYRAQFGVKFSEFGLAVFAENELMFLKFDTNSSIYSEGGEGGIKKNWRRYNVLFSILSFSRNCYEFLRQCFGRNK